ncbi:MAG: LLM class flavin-dependent oxidoreductase, partial [Deltaproteobacteria bacterium]|nr:LLM class flavin-dependent oxidoreductase [Deltaproteobacteria bacterium]
FGIPLEELRERFRESLEIVLKAWTKPQMSHSGRFFQYRDLTVWPRPYQRPHPSVWMAATATLESFEYSGRNGFHMMLIPFLQEVKDLRAKVEAYLAARKKAGHLSPPRILGVYHIYVGEDGAEARASGATGIREYSRAAVSSHSLTPNVEEPASYHSHFAARQAMRKLSFDEMIAGNRVLFGSAVEVRAQIQYLREQLYLTDLAGLFALQGLTDAQARASMRRFMAEVAPHF